MINKELVPIKAHYFFYNAATGPIVPFLPLIAKQLGFSGSLVGIIYTILPISGLIAKPLFGGLADKFKLHKLFFITFQIVLTIAFLVINYIPKTEPKVKIICDNGSKAYLEMCSTGDHVDQQVSSLIEDARRALLKKHEGCQFSCFPTNISYFCHTWDILEFCNNRSVTKNKRIDIEAQLGDNLEHFGNCIISKIPNITYQEKIYRGFCQDSERVQCSVSCPKVPEVDKLLVSMTGVSSYQFYLFTSAAIISWIGMAVVVSIGDALCIDQLHGDSKNYGKQKMWGSMGFGLLGISGGYLVDVFSKDHHTKDYSVIFYIMLAAMLFDVLVSYMLKMNTFDNKNVEPSVLWELGSMIRESKVIVFAMWCIGAGMCTGIIWNFLFWYIEDLCTEAKVDWPKTLQGLMTGIQCFLGEMPFNFISGFILRKIGHINSMSLVLLTYAIRFMAYSLISNPWWFLIIEVLHGPSVGLCWPAMVSYGDKVAPPGTKATIQGLVGAIFEGIGVSLGSLLGGYLIEEYKNSSYILFRIFSVGSLVWLSVFWILQILLHKTKAYPLQQGHMHLASYYPPDDALFITTNQDLQSY